MGTTMDSTDPAFRLLHGVMDRAGVPGGLLLTRVVSLVTQRDEAKRKAAKECETAAGAVQAAAIGEWVLATINGEVVSDFAQSFAPVRDAQDRVRAIREEGAKSVLEWLMRNGKAEIAAEAANALALAPPVATGGDSDVSKWWPGY